MYGAITGSVGKFCVLRLQRLITVCCGCDDVDGDECCVLQTHGAVVGGAWQFCVLRLRCSGSSLVQHQPRHHAVHRVLWHTPQLRGSQIKGTSTLQPGNNGLLPLISTAVHFSDGFLLVCRSVNSIQTLDRMGG